MGFRLELGHIPVTVPQKLPVSRLPPAAVELSSLSLLLNICFKIFCAFYRLYFMCGSNNLLNQWVYDFH